MAEAGAIRAGGAQVEIGADDSKLFQTLERDRQRLVEWAARVQGETAAAMGRGPMGPELPMTRRLRESQERMQRWVRENAAAPGRGDLMGGLDPERMAAASAGLGTMEVLIGRVMLSVHGLRAALNAGTAAVEMFQGGWEKAIDTFMKMPLATEVDALISRLAGLPTWAEFTAEKVRALRDELASLTNVGKLADITAGLTRDINLEGLTGQARELAELTQQVQARSREIWDAFTGAGGGADAAFRRDAALAKLDEWRKMREAGIGAAPGQAQRAKGQAALDQAWEQFAQQTMSEEDFLTYQVRRMGLAPNQAESVLSVQLSTLWDKQAKADARERAAEAARQAEEWMGQVREGFTHRFGLAEGLEASLRTPGERLAEELAGIEEVADLITPVTRARAELQALLKAQAAGVDLAAMGYKDFGIAGKAARAAQPTIGAASTFYAWEAGGMAVGRGDAMLSETRKIAENTTGLKQAIEKTVLRFG